MTIHSAVAYVSVSSGVKRSFHAVFARVYYAAPIVLEAERAGNNDVRPLDLCFAAFEISIKVLIAGHTP